MKNFITYKQKYIDGYELELKKIREEISLLHPDSEEYAIKREACIALEVEIQKVYAARTMIGLAIVLGVTGGAYLAYKAIEKRNNELEMYEYDERQFVEEFYHVDEETGEARVIPTEE